MSVVHRSVAVLLGVTLAGVTSCSSDSASSDTATSGTAAVTDAAATTSTTAVAVTPSLDVESCPVDDEAFCATAVQVVSALAARDVATLVDLSRETITVCAEMAVEYFPQCAAADVLVGHSLSSADLLVDVVTVDRYRSTLGAQIGGLDDGFVDELGAGAVQIVGVGTCGPDVPGQRTYHVSWTAGRSAEDRSQRVLGSFELTFETDWRIALSYFDSLDAWRAAHADPMHDAFCKAGRTPWSA